MRNGMLLALAAAVCAACSMNGGLPGGGGGAGATGPVAVRFASDAIVAARGMAAGPARVAGSQWEGGEAIGVYMVGNGTTAAADNAENIEFATVSTGTAAAFTSATPVYYPADGSAVDFIAYHPHQGLANWKYEADVSTGKQASQSGIDLMWAGVVNNGGPGYTKTDASAAVNLPFKHQLVKLEMAVTNGAGVADLDGLAVTIKGMNTKAEFDVKTGALGNESGAADIEPLKGAGSYKYEAILLPVELGAAHAVEFAVGGKTYTWKLDGLGPWAAGSRYSYQVEVTKHAVAVTGTIAGWAGGSGAGAKAD